MSGHNPRFVGGNVFVNLLKTMPIDRVAVFYEETAKKCGEAASLSLVAAMAKDFDACEVLAIEVDAHLKAMAICLRRLGRFAELATVEKTIVTNHEDLVQLRRVRDTARVVGKVNSFG